jgi:hypothetical protein
MKLTYKLKYNLPITYCTYNLHTIYTQHILLVSGSRVGDCGRGLRRPHQEAVGGVHQGEAAGERRGREAEAGEGGGGVRVSAQGRQLLPARRYTVRQVGRHG